MKLTLQELLKKVLWVSLRWLVARDALRAVPVILQRKVPRFFGTFGRLETLTSSSSRLRVLFVRMTYDDVISSATLPAVRVWDCRVDEKTRGPERGCVALGWVLTTAAALVLSFRETVRVWRTVPLGQHTGLWQTLITARRPINCCVVRGLHIMTVCEKILVFYFTFKICCFES